MVLSCSVSEDYQSIALYFRGNVWPKAHCGIFMQPLTLFLDKETLNIWRCRKPCAVEAHLENAAVRFGKRLFDLKSTDTRHTVAGGAPHTFFQIFLSISEQPFRFQNVIEFLQTCPFRTWKWTDLENITSFSAWPFDLRKCLEQKYRKLFRILVS